MVSRSTAHRHAVGDRINSIGQLAMVACQYCAKKNRECRMSSLKEVCGNCYRNGIKECVPVEVPAPDFSKLDRELARLEQQESEADAAESAALEALLAARAKKDRLRKQRKVLARREQKLAEESGKFVEDIEALEAAEDINREVGILESGLMPGTLALDWGAFSPTYLEGDPTFDDFLGESHGTAQAVGDNS
jgi:hypothetical protein